jgi:hypothetical protein
MNTDVASWAFNMPRTSWGHWRHNAGMMAWLKGFRALALILMVVVVSWAGNAKWCYSASHGFSSRSSGAATGRAHPYYLFVPIIGLAIAVGGVFTWVYDITGSRLLQAVVILSIFGGLLYLTDRSIPGDIGTTGCGGSARRGFASLSDLQALHPALPRNVTIYFDDRQESVSWEHCSGQLIKMAYHTDDISLLYASLGDGLPVDGNLDNIMLFTVNNDHLVEKTAEYRENPNLFIHYSDSEIYNLELSATEVTAGRDKYKITIRGVHDVPVRITYTINDGPLQGFTAGFNNEGSVTFDVSAQTIKGVYRFVGFNIRGNEKWIRSDKTLTVR